MAIARQYICSNQTAGRAPCENLLFGEVVGAAYFPPDAIPLERVCDLN